MLHAKGEAVPAIMLRAELDSWLCLSGLPRAVQLPAEATRFAGRFYAPTRPTWA